MSPNFNEDTLVPLEALIVQAAEAQVLQEPRHPTAEVAAARQPEYVLNPTDKTVLMDHKGRPVTVDRILATKPLKSELLTRPGPGGRQLTYLSGETVSRILNDIFGFDGWHLQIIKTEQIVCAQEEKRGSKMWVVAYTAHVRITHRNSGTFKEDLGAGDSSDRHMPTAVQHAMKASITDAMKRAARHFGDKLGNSLYGNTNMKSAPDTLSEALDLYDRERAKSKFGDACSNSPAVQNVIVGPKNNASPIEPKNRSTHVNQPAQNVLPPRPPLSLATNWVAMASTTPHTNPPLQAVTQQSSVSVDWNATTTTKRPETSNGHRPSPPMLVQQPKRAKVNPYS